MNKLTYKNIVVKLRSLANPKNVAGMARFSIRPKNILGINIPILRKMAKEIGKNHHLAQQLWLSGIHEARLLATMIDDPQMVEEKQMDSWTADFNSWDICDQCCANLFWKNKLAYQKAVEWTQKKEEFIKRAGYAMMAVLAVHDKKTTDESFISFFPFIKQGSTDERNFVKKAVNWALRQIGKRNKNLNKQAIKLAKEIKSANWRNKTAKWIANDALRELTKKTSF